MVAFAPNRRRISVRGLPPADHADEDRREFVPQDWRVLWIEQGNPHW